MADDEQFVAACAKISNGEQLLSEAYESLKQDLDSVRREKLAFDSLTKALSQVHFDSTIKLNVGGKIYKTTLETLRKDPDSLLSSMFSGLYDLKVDGEDGAYFIDRDAELFRYILHYLQHGELVCPNDRAVRRELLSEAKFYQVQGIIAELEGEILPNLLKSSVIIKDESHCLAVMSWLPPSATCSLLFRASTGGGNLGDFHRCCDYKGPTLVVVKSGDYICGGYTSKSWRSRGSITTITDNRSFLFTLVNPSGTKPLKIGPIPEASGGIRCQRDLGPTFGIDKNFELRVHQKDNLGCFVGDLNLGNGFTCPQKAEKRTFFTGKLKPF